MHGSAEAPPPPPVPPDVLPPLPLLLPLALPLVDPLPEPVLLEDVVIPAPLPESSSWPAHAESDAMAENAPIKIHCPKEKCLAVFNAVIGGRMGDLGGCGQPKLFISLGEVQ